MIKEFLKSLYDFFFPPLCFGCLKQTAGEKICFSCYQKIFSQPIIFKNHIRIYALGHYAIPFVNLINEFKYQNRTFIAQTLALALSKIIINDYYLKDCDFLVPVPLHPARLRERGYNQSEMLAFQISQITNIKVLKCLKRIKYTKSQTVLADKERRINVEKAFAFDKNYSIENKKIILIDDVVTTGATLKNCAQVLYKNKAQEVFGLVVAKS